MNAPLPPDEEKRLQSLREYEILDTAPEAAFDQLSLLAAQICQTPIAMISLLDEHRLWFKSRLGLSAEEIPRELAFCAHTILEKDVILEVSDALLDPRFADNPLVTSDPKVRFYAGAPLTSPDGHTLGALCVLDRVPHHLTADQLTALRALGRQAMAHLELHRRTKVLEREAVERRNSEAKAIQSQIFLQGTLDALSAHLAILDARGVITSVNAGWNQFEIQNGQRMDRRSLGSNYLAVCDSSRGEGEDDAQAVARGLRSVMGGKAHEFSHEYPCHSPTEKRWFTVRITRFGSGNEHSVVVAHENITARKNVEEVLLASMAAAESANLAKSEFLSTISHELRTPMIGVLGMNELLLETPLDDQQRSYAETVSRSGASLMRLINDLLDFNKIEKKRLIPKRVDFDLAAVLADLIDSFSESAQDKGIALGCTLAPGMPSEFCGDFQVIHQILMHLIGNAIKFTPSGKVQVRVSVVDERENSFLLKFSVKDTGIGIAAEQTRLLFQRFSQVDSSNTRHYGGTGIGLATAKLLVNLLGGEIGMRSEPAKGSEFWFTTQLLRPTTMKNLTMSI